MKRFFAPSERICEPTADHTIPLVGLDFDFGDRNMGRHYQVKIFSNAVVWPRYTAIFVDDCLVKSSLYDEPREYRTQKNLYRYPLRKITGYVTSIDFLWSGKNHYHQLIDLHSRLWALRHPDLKSIKVTLLHCFDWSDDYVRLIREIAPNVLLRKVSPRIRFRCEKFIHLPILSKSLLPELRNDVTSMGYLPVSFVRFHQEESARIFPTSRTFSKFIFLSRVDAAKRRVMNQSSLLCLLHKYGFEEVILGEIPLAEQFAALRNAKVIIGIHGAGMANIIAALECPNYLEIWSGSHGFHPVLSKAEDIGLVKYDQVRGNAAHIHDDFEVPLDKVEDWLTKIGVKKSCLIMTR
jgi:hypothetical protein